MGKLLCDNAKEFRGKMLSRACREWGIDPEFRPVKLPHYGGHIERLMGTVANEIRTLDGATFSNPKERGSYDSEGTATQDARRNRASPRRLLRHGWYHERFHHGIDGSPKERWRVGIQGDGKKPERACLPSSRIPRTAAGLHAGRGPDDPGIRRRPRSRALLRRRDEALDQSAEPEAPRARWEIPVPARSARCQPDLVLGAADRALLPDPVSQRVSPAVSLWEIKTAKAELIKDGRAKIDERTLMEGVLRRRSLAEDARQKTKTARREHHRATRLAAKAPVDTSVDATVTPRPTPARSVPVDDIFAEPPPVFTIRPNTNVR